MDTRKLKVNFWPLHQEKEEMLGDQGSIGKTNRIQEMEKARKPNPDSI
jgi:hypothetical protein